MFSFLPSTLPLGPGFCVWFLPQVGLHHDVCLVLTCLAYCLGRTWPLTSPMWAWSAWSACRAPRQFDQHQAQIFPPSLKSHDLFYLIFHLYFFYDQGQARKLPTNHQVKNSLLRWASKCIIRFENSYDFKLSVSDFQVIFSFLEHVFSWYPALCFQ